MNIKKVMLVIFGVVIAVSLYGVILDAIKTLLDNENLSEFTGLSTIIAVVPIIVLIAILFKLGIFNMFGGKKD